MDCKKLPVIILVFISLLLLISFIALSFGLERTSFLKLFYILTDFLKGKEDNIPLYNIIIKIRLPRVILAALIGAGLSTSGLIFQSILRNPLADPYLLGVSTGSALGVVIFTSLGLHTFFVYGIVVAAFLGGIISVFIVFYFIPWALLKNQISLSADVFILSGVVISFLFGSLIVLVMSFSQDVHYQKIFYWLMGSLSMADFTKIKILIPYLIIIFPFLAYYAKPLNLIQISDESAISLGVNPFRVKKRLLVLVSILTSVVVAVSGTIGFVGLIVPHFVKYIFGYDNRINIWIAPLSGAVFMILADMFARVLSFNVEIPVGAVTTLLGAPIFILIITRKGRV